MNMIMTKLVKCPNVIKKAVMTAGIITAAIGAGSLPQAVRCEYDYDYKYNKLYDSKKTGTVMDLDKLEEDLNSGELQKKVKEKYGMDLSNEYLDIASHDPEVMWSNPLFEDYREELRSEVPKYKNGTVRTIATNPYAAGGVFLGGLALTGIMASAARKNYSAQIASQQQVNNTESK